MNTSTIILTTFLVLFAFFVTACTTTTTTTSSSPSPPTTPMQKPSDGWTLHIDAKQHYPETPSFITHHYCKTITTGFLQCQLYDSDTTNAKLIGVEIIIDQPTYDTFTNEEQQLWHYHKEEIQKVEATLPDLTEEAAQPILEQLLETYGKIYTLWNPLKTTMPTGQPTINLIP